MGVIILKKQLENDLKKIYTDVPMPNPINIQETIIQVRREVNQAQNKGLTFWEFYFQQFGFIRKNVWAIQFIILLFLKGLLSFRLIRPI